MGKGNPFFNFVKFSVIAIALFLWVILPDLIPFIIDDIIAGLAAIGAMIAAIKEFSVAVRT